MRQRNPETSRGREQPWLLRQFVRPVQPHIGENVALPQSLIIGAIILLMFISFIVLYNLVGGALAPSSASKTAPRTSAPGAVPLSTTSATRAPVTSSPASATNPPTKAPGGSPIPAATATTVPPTVAQSTPPIGATAAPTAAGGIKYKVKAGDTLLIIAAKYGVTVQAIMTANNLKNDTIYAGEELIIPPPR